MDIRDLTIEDLQEEAVRRGYQINPLPRLIQVTVSQVALLGIETAAGLAAECQIAKTAASNRLAAARKYGLLDCHSVGRELVYHLAVDPEEFQWIDDALEPCPLCNAIHSHVHEVE